MQRFRTMRGITQGTTEGTVRSAAPAAAPRERPVRRYRRAMAALGVTGAALVVLSACEPSAGGLNSAAVAMTTDRTATSTLERIGFKVNWFSCTAAVEREDAEDAEDASRAPRPTASRAPFAEVECKGETGSGQKITLEGRVTEERSGTCVRGRLIARVDGELVFEARVLGKCGAGTPSTPARPGGPRPAVTVTVTETVTVTPGK
jgi:hypothetical protein